MRKVLHVLLFILIVPIFLVTFTVIHELGHTILARLLGDPDSVFYLARFEGQGICLGCNIYDASKLSWGGNLVVSLGGLLATQLFAVGALLLLKYKRDNPLLRRMLGAIALGFAFLDVPVQGIQGLLYNLDHQRWPTNVDLVDVMLLLQAKVELGQILLKGLLFTMAVLYLWAFVRFYRQTRALNQV